VTRDRRGRRRGRSGAEERWREQYRATGDRLTDLRDRVRRLERLGTDRTAMQEAVLRDLRRQIEKAERHRSKLLGHIIQARQRHRTETAARTVTRP
jgi:hypothetical protein